MAGDSILAIDQGTTSTRAMVFDRDARPLAVAQQELPQIFPADGWVEHDPEEIWRATLAVCREVLEKVPGVAAIGITNQRETTVLWERKTGKPLHNAIVWQDRRGAALCQKLEQAGHGALVEKTTGSIPISPPARSPGFWRTYQARRRKRRRAIWPSAPSTRSFSGG
jgi:glycerol kinase